MIAQVRAFIEANSGAQFPLIDRDASEGYPANWRQPYQSGWRKTGDQEAVIYLCFPERFKSVICEGYDYRDVCQALLKAGILLTDGTATDKRHTKKMPAPNVKGRMPFFVLDATRLFDRAA